LGINEVIVKKHLNGVSRTHNVSVQRFFTRTSWFAKNVVGTLLFGDWFSNTNAKSREILSSESACNRTKTVVASESATLFELQTTRLEVELIVSNH